MPSKPPLLALLAPALVVCAESSWAGPLAQTARGVDNRQSSSSSSRDSASSSSSSASHGDSSDDGWVDRDRDRDRDTADDPFVPTSITYLPDAGTCDPCTVTERRTRHRGRPMIDPPRGSIEIAAQDVTDSDHAFRGAIEAATNRVGFRLQADHYRERIESKMAEESVTMNLWSLAATARVVRLPGVSFDLHGGFGGAGSTHFESMAGPHLGAALQVSPQANLTFVGRVRTFYLDDGISAVDGVVGLRAASLWLGYRALKFDVGPAIEGPEVGLALAF